MEKDYAESIAAIIKEYPDAIIISDEIFSDMVLDSKKKTVLAPKTTATPMETFLIFNQRFFQ